MRARTVFNCGGNMAKKQSTATKVATAKPVEKKEEPAVAVEKQEKEAVAMPAKAVTATQTESQTVAPETAQLSARTAKNFTAYLLPEVVYGDEAALDVLRQQLRAYKEIHPGFLAKTEEKDAFVCKREYLPVYRQSAVVDYSWTLKNKGAATDHTERREVSCRQHSAPAFFRADSFPADVKTIALASPKQAEELYPCKHKTFSACVTALKNEAKAYAPQKSAKMQLYNRAYEIFYVPVLKATCTFDGKEYVAYVNLLNGECDAQYLVSDKLIKKSDKVMAGVRTCRRLIIFTLLYALTFAGLGWYYAYVTATMKPLMVQLICMSAATALPLICYLFCFSYKRNKFILQAVQTGKLPRAILPRVFALLCVLIALAEMLVFALYILRYTI